MTDNDAAKSAERGMRLLSPLRAAQSIGPEALGLAVHGLVLFVAIIGATFVGGYPVWKMFVYSAAGVILFYCAHVYSAVLAAQHTADGSVRVGIKTIGHEMKRTLPLLEATIAPALPLVLAVIGVIPAPLAYATSLAVGLLTLAAVGFLALHNRHGSVRRSLFAAFVAAGFGAVIILAETYLH